MNEPANDTSDPHGVPSRPSHNTSREAPWGETGPVLKRTLRSKCGAVDSYPDGGSMGIPDDTFPGLSDSHQDARRVGIGLFIWGIIVIVIFFGRYG
jgi:hypothetical protein